MPAKDTLEGVVAGMVIGAIAGIATGLAKYHTGNDNLVTGTGIAAAIALVNTIGRPSREIVVNTYIAGTSAFFMNALTLYVANGS